MVSKELSKKDVIGGSHDEQENTQPEFATEDDIYKFFKNVSTRYDKDSETLYLDNK